MMTSAADEILDVAIVGGGVSGLYSGWRLLTGESKAGGGAPIKKVAVFELSGRTGGRLLTWRPFDDHTSLHGELGGMRFVKSHRLLWSLIHDYFVPKGVLKPAIPFAVSDPNNNDICYLRSRLLKTSELADPDKVPYRLDARERYAAPMSLMTNVIDSVLAENGEIIAEHLGGRTRPVTWQDWDAVKPHLRYRQQRLWDVGWWNLLSDYFSPEGFAFVQDAFGYFTATYNWNAAEAMQAIGAPAEPYHTLEEGYDYVPYLLRQEFVSAGGEVRLRQAVRTIDRRSDGVLELRLGDSDRPVLARHVVLAMPRRSLELLQETALWKSSRALENDRTTTLSSLMESVISFPALKMFLAYPSPWWRSAPVSIAAGRTVCDLPIRQTYYFPSVAAFDAATPPLDGRALLMASYDDVSAVTFWRALEGSPALKADLKELMRSLTTTKERAAEPGWRAHRAETAAALADEPGFHYMPPEMVRHARDQVRMVHYNQPLPDPMPLPGNNRGLFLAAYKDWSHDPFGGGWNYWAPGVNVKTVMERMRRPFPEVNLCIVGEAYSGLQGWVEGSLTSAELALREHFSLKEERWQPSGYYMGY